jgi:uncharacterized membrane protein YkgB
MAFSLLSWLVGELLKLFKSVFGAVSSFLLLFSFLFELSFLKVIPEISSVLGFAELKAS